MPHCLVPFRLSDVMLVYDEGEKEISVNEEEEMGANCETLSSRRVVLSGCPEEH